MVSRLIYILKFIILTIIFLFIAIVQNNLLLIGINGNLVPDISIFIIFYLFFVDGSISYFGVFLLCIMFDVINMLPTCVTAISTLIACKVIEAILSKTVLNIKKNMPIIFLIYFLVYNIIELFIMMYLYDRYFIPLFVNPIINFFGFIAFKYVMEYIHNLVGREN